MAHFAHISEDNTVLQVIVIDNAHIGEPTLSFPDTEGAGRAFIANTLGLSGEWRQTSYGASFRYNYAGIGFTFDPKVGEHGAFIPPQPFPSWTLDDQMNWQPPLAMPTDGFHVWNEGAQEWQAVTE